VTTDQDDACPVGGVRAALNAALRGKAEVVEHVLACLLARGHLLVEDLPGLGKTTLAKALAQALGGKFARVQCTPDLLPGDITGFRVYDQYTREFEFLPGPVISDVLLADEINRTTPRTQSALLEAMAERQVTVDNFRHVLSDTFFVIATQNPVEQHGTYPLPEAQLDRFAMTLRVGYPDQEHELAMLEAAVGPGADAARDSDPVMSRLHRDSVRFEAAMPRPSGSFRERAASWIGSFRGPSGDPSGRPHRARCSGRCPGLAERSVRTAGPAWLRSGNAARGPRGRFGERPACASGSFREPTSGAIRFVSGSDPDGDSVRFGRAVARPSGSFGDEGRGRLASIGETTGAHSGPELRAMSAGLSRSRGPAGKAADSIIAGNRAGRSREAPPAIWPRRPHRAGVALRPGISRFPMHAVAV
jgi:MoxR-like ATPase